MVAVTKGTVPIVPVAQRRAERSEGRQSEPSPLSWRFLTYQVFLIIFGQKVSQINRSI